MNPRIQSHFRASPYADPTGVRRTYASMVAAMDEAGGGIVAAIDETGRPKATFFVFAS